MDNFMGKIAQKLNSQEVIRANAAADAAQIDKLNTQVAEYDACMKEMRRLNLKNVENEQKLQNLVEKNSEQIMKMFEESSTQIQKVAQECIAKINEMEISIAAEPVKEDSFRTEDIEKLEKTLEELKDTAVAGFSKMDDAFRQADDYVHKENVKVYRNVQAVVIEELEKQSQVLRSYGEITSGKARGMGIISIITLVVSLINMALLIMHLLGVF